MAGELHSILEAVCRTPGRGVNGDGDRLAGSGDGLTITDLATRMGVERTTLTRNLDLMAREGLVSVDPGADARSKRVALTPSGKAALEKAIPLWQRAQASITAVVGDWPTLRAEIEKLGNAARDAS